MLDHRPSATALRVALRRAAHQILDVPPVLDDPLALRIIGENEAAALRADPASSDQSPLSPYLRAFFAARSRFAEDSLAEAFARGVHQYVVLGAGLDTFAYRNPHRELRVFEVDHPSSQAWKKDLLEKAGMTIPSGVTFVPVDFERQSLGEELDRAGLASKQPTFFSWLGVTPYLTRAAVLGTLGYVAHAAKGGGGIVFDYSIDPAAMTWLQRLAFNRMAERVKAAGEPWQTFFDPAALAAELTAMGFFRVEDLGGDQINTRYFAGRTDGLRVGGAGRLLRATA